MPSSFKGNYLQHIMDIFLNDGLKYEDISEAYTAPGVKEDSVRKSHTTAGRGNLPRGVTPEEFFQDVVLNFYQAKEPQRELARQLCVGLKHDDLFPEEWTDREEMISGFSDQFDETLFQTFLIYLLRMDKKTKRTETPREKTGKARKTVSAELEFSSKFFNAGARELVGAPKQRIAEELRRLSGIFGKIIETEYVEDGKTFAYGEDDLLLQLRDYIACEAKSYETKEILKIKGPLGSYKNRIMQYLYIAIEDQEPGVLPFYMDIASYEKMAEGDKNVSESDFLKAFEEDIEAVERIAASNSGRTPLLMLDGIRDFFCRKEALYYVINERIKLLDFKLVICVDTDFTINNQHKYKVHPVVSNNYSLYLRIRSMNLNRRAESVEFIRSCIDVFGVKVPKNITPEIIYESLLRLDFLTIDAYWLVYILNANLNDVINHKNNISGLYHSLCLQFLGSHQRVDEAAEFAYEFEFGRMNFENTDPYFDLRWRLIRKHRSVLDFLIAKHYIKKVSDLNLKGGSREQNIKNLSFFNMVLQKNVTRFVVAMLKGNDDYEHQIMIIAKDYYDNLSLFGKSELTFWMARLQNAKRKRECVHLLQSYNKKELRRYAQNQFGSIEEKRDAAFLIRGISVSLIYENDKEALRYYLDSLLTDKIANSVNRGFHLEYYGDKPYIPNKSLLDFEDDISKGESTLTVLCLSLDRRIKRNDVNALVAVLEIMTLCNLIQARIEYRDGVEVLDVSPYIGKCLKYLNWIMKQRMLRGLYDVCVYFNWMYTELTELLKISRETAKKPLYYRSDTINKLSRASDVSRTGWVDLKVPHPENIVEHMYNCWLIGMLYLPKESEIAGYSKNDILQMLLIHDLGETQTGDISRPQKRENQAFYDRQERSVMQGLLLSGTYPGSVDLNEYLLLWNEWDKQNGINYLIAKDIDNIQTVYQFCAYCLKYPELFSENDVFYWLSGLQEIETDIGKEIVDVLITQNPAFKKVIELYEQDV